eukprot:scaffold297399_cov22-Tisochrysis_lutea.AAC.1
MKRILHANPREEELHPNASRAARVLCARVHARMNVYLTRGISVNAPTKAGLPSCMEPLREGGWGPWLFSCRLPLPCRRVVWRKGAARAPGN